MTWIIVLSSCISAIATVAIAIYAFKSHQLAEAVRTKNDDNQRNFNDLLKAIATSTLLSASGQPTSSEFSRKVKQFNEWNAGGLILPDPKG
jgi:uncharacterized membrane protein